MTVPPELVRIYREEIGRITATLIRRVGDFALAEEIAHDAFVTALEQWPAGGVPENAAGWLVSTARHKALDIVKRRSMAERKLREVALVHDIESSFAPETDDDRSLGDDRLRLLFTCCHPSLAIEAQVPLVLRTLCGLTTEEIARAFLVPVPTMAQRLVRAKSKISAAKIPYRVPERDEIDARLEPVMAAVYLVFGEGYAATSGDVLVRRELCAEAIRLGKLLAQLMTGVPEIEGLIALMLLHDARRDARVDADGDVVLLDAQDRSRWDQSSIQEGLMRVERVLRASRGNPGPYALQAAIAGCHAKVKQASETDWNEIVALYDLLLARYPTPIVALNRAAAVSVARGPAAALAEIEALERSGALATYHLLFAAKADLLRRLERVDEATAAYRQALALATAAPEQRFLAKRLAELEARSA